MYDLRNGGADRSEAKWPALSRAWGGVLIANGARAIGLPGARAAALFGLIAVACGCPAKVTAPRVADAAAPQPVERWVDASAQPGGKGSSDQPLRELSAALAPGALIHLAPGIYPGPITLPDGATLISKNGLGVIAIDGPGVVITAGRGRLEGISVQGGEVGLVVKGRLEVSQVRLSGQRLRGARVESAGQLVADRLEVVGVIADADGVEALPGAKVELKGARFSGGLRRAIDATDAEVTLESVASVGVKEQLHLEGGRARVHASSSSSGSGPAYFVARASFTADGLTVQGHEYAVLTGNAAQVELVNLDARAPQLAAVGAVKSKLALARARLEGGTFAAVQLLESDSALSEVQIFGARGNGVVVRQGKARLEKVTVHEVAMDGDSGGDGFHLRGAEVWLREVMVRNAGGAAVLVSAAAQVQVDGLGSEACRAGALVVELGSRVEARGVVVKDPGGPAVSGLEGATVSVTDLLLSGVQVPVWAECDAGAKVTLTGVRGANDWRPPRCVTVRRAP
jgi:hypothetical protein